MLKIDIESKTFDKKNILKKFHIEIADQEFISIIGPSGCGKTTLLKIIAGVEEGFDGVVEFSSSKSKKIENLGYIFQDPRLLPWLSVKENIMLVSKSKNEKEIESYLEEVGLKEYINSYPKELSGGMKRRVSIIRAFINRPEVLLLDEAFISLDYPTAQYLRKLIYRLYEEFLPIVILVTHDLDEALSMSQRVVFLSTRPSSIIYEYKNRPTFDEDTVAKSKKTILQNYPNLLSGVL